ncbi:glutathione S-transferase family protein [Ralstonia sp. UBA689]|uniref:glutathione S-transferase family protein n=1 Tax=Ralstonia sp. UBA689 TaxID=1947373 RepID=UPI0025F1A807|nr:glutathione S-transferase [Ralstonia sp. UBA689]
MLRIWGRLSSVNVQKVVWCAHELSLDHERIDVGGAFGGVNTPEFLAMNPNGMIPVIEDGINDTGDERFVLWESNAIVRYLCSRYDPGNLYPLELHERADADRWMDWQTTTFSPSMVDAFLQLVRTPEDQRDAARIERSRQAAERTTGILDAVLAKQPYVAGQRFTMADIACGCAAHRWLGLPMDRPARPNLERWMTELRDRRAAREVLALPVV